MLYELGLKLPVLVPPPLPEQMWTGPESGMGCKIDRLVFRMPFHLQIDERESLCLSTAIYEYDQRDITILLLMI